MNCPHESAACKRLWERVVIDAVVIPYRKAIIAARNGEKSFTHDGVRTVVGTEAEEIEHIRRYLASEDWRIVASHAGVEASPETVLRRIIAGVDDQAKRSEVASKSHEKRRARGSSNPNDAETMRAELAPAVIRMASRGMSGTAISKALDYSAPYINRIINDARANGDLPPLAARRQA